MKCQNCKKTIKDNILFCPHCGLIPTTSSNKSDENVVFEGYSLRAEKLMNYARMALPFFAIAVICLWFCKSLSLSSGGYGIELSLFFFMKGLALLSVMISLVSLVVRIIVLIKKEKQSVLLYSVSAFSDVISLGCIIYKLIEVKSKISNEIYGVTDMAEISLNTFGWIFIAVCVLSVLLHLLLILFCSKLKGNS